ncbi:Protein K04C2.5 [Aphelenchoides avenae]|nr:Protein K04C2.5 [Aphelenchus avenae]
MDFTEFLFRNQEICDHPFSQAEFVPALDECSIKCKPLELCVENDDFVQKCIKLPQKCIESFNEQQVQTVQTLSKRLPIRGVQLVNGGKTLSPKVRARFWFSQERS